MITQSEIRKLLYYNFINGLFTWKEKVNDKIKIGDVAGSFTDGYIAIQIKGKSYKAHRLAWLWMKGYFPEHGIDHEDRIRNHNWWSNLREASNQCNARNTGNFKNNKSGVKGIHPDKSRNKYCSKIVVDGKGKHLGYFKDFDEAVCHRLAAEQCLDWDNCDSNSPALNHVRDILC